MILFGIGLGEALVDGSEESADALIATAAGDVACETCERAVLIVRLGELEGGETDAEEGEVGAWLLYLTGMGWLGQWEADRPACLAMRP